MSKRKNIKRNQATKQRLSPSGHIITARPYNSNGRFVVLFAAAFLILMVAMSVMALSSAPTNPAVWATLVFFGGLLTLLLTNEENIFPNLTKEKRLWAICAWFIAFIVSPYIIVNMTSFNFVLFIFVIIFLLILTPLVVRLFVNDDRWSEIKTNVKDKVTPSRLKKSKKKKEKGLSGINRKRKIYRR